MFRVFSKKPKASKQAITEQEAAAALATKMQEDKAMLLAAASSSSATSLHTGAIPPPPPSNTHTPKKSTAFHDIPNRNGSSGKGSLSARKLGALSLLATPSLKSTPPGERPAMFLTHLGLAQQIFNFNDPMAELEEKEAKRMILLGLVEHINSAKDVFTEATLPSVMSFLSANLFRDLPSEHEDNGEDSEEPALEPAWPHLQIVYEFLLRFVVSADVDAKLAKKYISQSFISQLLELFNSQDPREREYLKTILHRIYGKIMSIRAFIRRSLNYCFFRLMYSSETHNGVGELLEILGSIINGFALPLKAEHKRFLVRALIPLHKVHGVAMFHNQLSYCVSQFVEKDPKTLEAIVLGILRFWPHCSAPKQILFLNELEDLLELTQPAEFTKICVPLFETLNVCMGSPHFQVSERALFLFNNEYVVSLVNQNRHTVLPIVISSLNLNSTLHWNQTVMALTSNVVKLFIEMDAQFYRECQNETSIQEKLKAAAREARIQQWEMLEKEAAASDVI